MIQKRNYTLDLIRFIMALLIVALHCYPFMEYSIFVSYVPSQILSRIAVPFFAAVAGYYFFKSNNKKKYSQTIFRYVQKYTIWSIIYFIYMFIINENILKLKDFLSYMIGTYLFTGFYHLWYMLAVIYTIFILWLLSKFTVLFRYLYISSFIFLIIGVLMFGYGKFFFRFPIVQNTLGLIDQDINMQSQWLFSIVPFFMLGYSLNKRNAFISKLYNKCEVLLLIVFIIYVLELIILKIFDLMSSTTLCFSTYPLVFLIMITALKYPSFGNEKISNYCSKLSSFIYFSHILFILILQNMGISETPTYFFTIMITVSIGLVITKINNPVLNRFI